MSCCTITTDAGFYPIEDIGSYAFYIKSDHGVVTRSGKLKSCKTSLHAEIQAIANALVVLENLNWPRIHTVIINTDCLYAINQIMTVNRQKKFPEADHARQTLHRLQRRYNQTHRTFHEFRLVKSHNGTPDARSYVNDWCDKQCKEQLVIYKRELLQIKQ